MEQSHYTVVFLSLEILDFLLAFHNQSYRHALHASGGESRFDFFPKHRRQFEAHDAVEHTARLLGVHTVDVDAARRLDGVKDCAFGDFVKYDAFCLFRRQTEHLVQVPSDGFSFAVLIGSEPDRVCLFRFSLQLLHKFLLVGRDFIYGFVVVLHVDAEILLLKVADVAIT